MAKCGFAPQDIHEMVHNERLEKFLTLSISMQDCRNPLLLLNSVDIFLETQKRLMKDLKWTDSK